MQAIYNKKGRTVGWIDEGVIRSRRGEPVALLDGENVFTCGGAHVGVFSLGFFRDHEGDAVAFVAGASGGPAIPTPEVPPAPPVGGVAPPPPVEQVVPAAAVPSASWSIATWDQFINGL